MTHKPEFVTSEDALSVLASIYLGMRQDPGKDYSEELDVWTKELHAALYREVNGEATGMSVAQKTEYLRHNYLARKAMDDKPADRENAMAKAKRVWETDPNAVA